MPRGRGRRLTEIERLRRQLNAVKLEGKGRVFTPNGNPPIIENARWYEAKMSHLDVAGDAVFTVQDFCNLARDQNGLFSTDKTNYVPIEIRFLSISCWQTGNSLTTREFQVVIYDPVNAQVLSRLYANQGYVRYGSVGYKWPLVVSQVPLHHSNVNNVLKIDVPGTNTVIVHLRYLWRSLNGEGYALRSLHQIPSECESIFESF